MKGFFRRFLPVLVLLSLFNPLFGQQPAQEADEGEAQEENAAEEQQRISLDLKGISIDELFKILAVKSGMTIITTPEVKGRVSVLLDNLTFNEALDVIVAKENLAYEKKGNVVKVMTAAEYTKTYGQPFGENRKTVTIKLTYAKPADILKVITSLKSELGKILSDEATGTLIITDTPQSLKIIEETIKELDQPLETEVFNVNYARFADIKGYIEALITPGVGQVIVDERSSKVVVSDLARRLSRIRKLMAEFDEQSRQVLINGEVVEVTLDDKFQSGVEWEKIFNESDLDGLDLVGEFPVSPTLSTYGKISMGTLDSDHYNVVLNLLKEYGSTKILTRPMLVAVNKEEAKILVGTREAYVTATQSQGEVTTLTSESVQFIDVGLKLTVVPTIGSDGYITMKIKPEISSVKETLTTESGTRVPIVQTSESESVVKIKDGATLIVAGLMKDTFIDDSDGMPKLARLPIVGSLFGKQTKEKKKTELIIFITPRIISATANAGRETKI